MFSSYTVLVMQTTVSALHDLRTLIRRLLGRWNAFASRSRAFGAGRPIYPSEMDAIGAIGRAPRINVTRLAGTLGVTKGAASQTVGKLVRKGLVRKVEGSKNASAREVCLVLTPRGRVAFRNDGEFFQLAYRLFLERYGPQAAARIQQLRETFAEFSAFFEEFIRRWPANDPIARRR